MMNGHRGRHGKMQLRRTRLRSLGEPHLLARSIMIVATGKVLLGIVGTSLGGQVLEKMANMAMRGQTMLGKMAIGGQVLGLARKIRGVVPVMEDSLEVKAVKAKAILAEASEVERTEA